MSPGYAYAPGYAYDDAYAYVPAPAYGYRSDYYGDRWSDQHRTNNFSVDSQR